MKRAISILSIILMSSTIFAQESNKNAITAAPEGRYEIIQSPLARKYTIKIDKETGDTWEMVLDANDKLCWQKLYKGSTPKPDTTHYQKINYQIFMGGISAKDIILINVNTGATWQLVYDTKEKCNWWSSMDKTSY